MRVAGLDAVVDAPCTSRGIVTFAAVQTTPARMPTTSPAALRGGAVDEGAANPFDSWWCRVRSDLFLGRFRADLDLRVKMLPRRSETAQKVSDRPRKH